MIRLRTVVEADRSWLRYWRNLSEIRQWMHTDHIISEPEHNHWFARALRAPNLDVIADYEGLGFRQEAYLRPHVRNSSGVHDVWSGRHCSEMNGS